jgi:hypothetical protein
MGASILDIWHVLHDDVFRLQRSGHAQEFVEQGVPWISRVARVLAADGEALTRWTAQQNVWLTVRKRVAQFVVGNQLNVPCDGQRILVIVGERLARPRINFNSANYSAPGEFEP